MCLIESPGLANEQFKLHFDLLDNLEYGLANARNASSFFKDWVNPVHRQLDQLAYHRFA